MWPKARFISFLLQPHEDCSLKCLMNFRARILAQVTIYRRLLVGRDDPIRPWIVKQDTTYRDALEPGLKLAVTLRYLATGNSYMDLAYNFRVANNSISMRSAKLSFMNNPVWGRARYLSVTEAPHNTDFPTWMGKKHFLFLTNCRNREPNPELWRGRQRC